MATYFEVECLDCQTRASFDPLSYGCATCGSPWRAARYDLPTAAESLRSQIGRRPFDLWRYVDLLPVSSSRPNLSMGEGGTPLYAAYNLGTLIGLDHLYIKDERQGPTASFKDRQAAVTVAALKEAGISEAVVASTGNVAISYSAYCARAGIKLWAFLTSLVPAGKMHEVALYGTRVVKLTTTYDEAKKFATEFAQRRRVFVDRGGQSILTIESMKTVAFEIAEQLALLETLPEDPRSSGRAWRSPDWYVQSVSGGLGPLGVLKGFQELQEMEMLSGVPAVACVQASGCAPMVEAWQRGQAKVHPITTPNTYISTLSTGDPGHVYTLLREQMLSASGGTMVSVSDEEAYQAMHTVAKMEGLSIEPATAVAFAGLFKLVRQSLISADQVVVINCTGHTLPIEEELLGENWAQDIVLGEDESPPSPQEGLLAALQLEQRRVRHVLVVDDHEEARRLIRRILQAQGEFVVQEADSGPVALAEAAQTAPDLIILDLMMPKMDGFSVLEELKHRPETAGIPVIVVTAKELSLSERKQLKGQISRLMTKGDFFGEDLVEEIERVLE